MATHLDTNHLHNHLVVNSVSCESGRKLHQSANDLLKHRQANDEICVAHRKNQIRLLELVDAEARLRDDVSLESFIAGFRLVCGIAHELGAEPPYSFRQEEEQRTSGV